MAKLEQHFEVFHNKIKVDSEDLIEKRDLLVGEVKDYLKENKLPSVELINQGSYIYGVGIVPSGDDEYDIDVGLAFNILKKDYSDPNVVRKWVLDAIEHHNRAVKSLNPCIRVSYSKGYHVDLVTYAKYNQDNSKEDFHIAFEKDGWKQSDPKKLKEYINSAIDNFKHTKFNDVGSTQLQRIVRYMKRWNDIQPHSLSQDKPTGIALLLLAIEYLKPTLDSDGNPDDLTALVNLLKKIEQISGRIVINKPTPEYDDVFKKISDLGMTKFKSNISTLRYNCEQAQKEVGTSEACDWLALDSAFGADFPVDESLTKSEALATMNSRDAKEYAKLAALKTMAGLVEVPTKPWLG